jgi:hypothetical protein
LEQQDTAGSQQNWYINWSADIKAYCKQNMPSFAAVSSCFNGFKSNKSPRRWSQRVARANTYCNYFSKSLYPYLFYWKIFYWKKQQYHNSADSRSQFHLVPNGLQPQTSIEAFSQQGWATLKVCHLSPENGEIKWQLYRDVWGLPYKIIYCKYIYIYIRTSILSQNSQVAGICWNLIRKLEISIRKLVM